MRLSVVQPEPCDEQALCRNSPLYKGQLGSRCRLCCLAKYSDIAPPQHQFQPLERGGRHPQVEGMKRQRARQRAQTAHRGRLSKDKGKRVILRRAEKAERKTESSLIQATKNSGRSNRDGDHLAAGRITLDTKHQSLRDHPVVHPGELEKVRQDAKRAGQLLGGLVLRNRHGLGVVVLHEDDFAVLVQLLEGNNS